MQYDVDHSEGFHAWFCAAGKQDVEVVTYNAEVYKGIVKYKKDNRPGDQP